MKKKSYAIPAITLILLFINGTIFLCRNRGFEYKEFLSSSASVTPDCDDLCITKWTKPNTTFLQTELIEGRKLLKLNTGIDSIRSTENRLLAISKWLNDQLSGKTGPINDSVNNLTPLKQFYCFKTNKQFSLDCGNFQAMFSFFSTSAGLSCRNFQTIQISADNFSAGSHVANEVYLKEYNKWVISDGYQNHLLIKKKNIPLSASEYLDYNIAGGADTVSFMKQTGNRILVDTIVPLRFKADRYFNKNYILYFYKEADIRLIYSLGNRAKRYFLPVTWYEMYAPQQNNSNLLFYIKQVFIIALAGWGLFLLFSSIRKQIHD